MKTLSLILTFYIFFIQASANQSCQLSTSEQIQTKMEEVRAMTRKLKASKEVTTEDVKELFDKAVSLTREINNTPNSLPHFMVDPHLYYREIIHGTSASDPLSSKQLENRRVTIKNGLAYNYKGEPIDTGSSLYNYIIINGELYVSKERVGYDEKIKHVTLGMGLPVSAAGEIVFKNGSLIDINSDSGRYRTPKFFLSANLKMLSEQGLEVPKNIMKSLDKAPAHISMALARTLESLGIRFTEAQKKEMQEYEVAHTNFLETSLKEYNVTNGKLVNPRLDDEDKIYDSYDRLLHYGKYAPSQVNLTHELIFQSILMEAYSRYAYDYLYELRYLAPFLDYSSFIEDLDTKVREGYFPENIVNGIKKFKKRTRYLNEIQKSWTVD